MKPPVAIGPGGETGREEKGGKFVVLTRLPAAGEPRGPEGKQLLAGLFWVPWAKREREEGQRNTHYRAETAHSPRWLRAYVRATRSRGLSAGA